MKYILGLHLGHDSSCAIVAEGGLIAAIQLERTSRLKHDGSPALSNRLPIKQCLNAAGIGIEDISVIVSSFQAASPGGVGLNYPIVEPDFSTFDPNDSRHLVISHHLAHAYAGLCLSGFDEAAVLVVDQAGSSTTRGADFALPFSEFQQAVITDAAPAELKSECLSIYSASNNSLRLVLREHGKPHNQNEVFVGNVATLYDNVSRFIFGRENAYGQLMALAGLPQHEHGGSVTFEDLIEISPAFEITYKQGWQNKCIPGRAPEDYIDLAAACQDAFTRVILAYVQRAALLTKKPSLAVSGGVFLNIKANTAIWKSNHFSQFYVPSAPHDAGVSAGCAFYGYLKCKENFHRFHTCVTDRVGMSYSVADATSVIDKYNTFIATRRFTATEVAIALLEGKIVARFAGRSEFGPRALGGRSILANPASNEAKHRLNKIKGRQNWRPVAPVVPEPDLSKFFSGPEQSPFMSFAHRIKPEYRPVFLALEHTDGTTRCQTIRQNDDPDLFTLLGEFGQLSGFPVLVNTSFNGRDEPIVNSPEQAVQMFLRSDDIDLLILENRLLERKDFWPNLDQNTVYKVSAGRDYFVSFSKNWNPRVHYLRQEFGGDLSWFS